MYYYFSMDPTSTPTTAESLISFVDQTEEIPNVVIFNIGEGQFVLDDLEWTLAIADNVSCITVCYV